MLDLHRIENDPDELKCMLASRHLDPGDVDGLLQQAALRRSLAAESDDKKALRNRISQQAGTVRLRGGDNAELKMIMEQMRSLGVEIAAIDVDIAELNDKINAFLLAAPNYPDPSVPTGIGEWHDAEVLRWHPKRKALQEPRPYWNLGTDLQILALDGTARPGSTRRTVYRALGAKLERAVLDFLVDTHVAAGYRTVTAPYRIALDGDAGTWRAPGNEMADVTADGCENRRPSQRASALSLYRNTVLDSTELPLSDCAFTAGFRSQAGAVKPEPGGSAPRNPDIELELVKICRPDESKQELTDMAELAQQNAAAARASLPGDAARRAQPLPGFIPDPRAGGLDARPRAIRGNLRLLQLYGLPGPPPEHPLSGDRRRSA